MLAQLNPIRDVSRALPALVAGPDLDVPVSAELLDAHATALRKQYQNLLPVIDRAGKALSEAMHQHDREQAADPEGEGAKALEQTEAYFKRRRKDLRRLRRAFVQVGAPPAHGVFRALDRLDDLYESIVATMQEVRWSVLIFDGVRDAADFADRRPLATSSEWLASLHDE